MKIWIHKGNGHYIGSSVVVLAEDWQQAHDMIRMTLDSMGLTKETVCIEKEVKLSDPVVVDAQSGDY